MTLFFQGEWHVEKLWCLFVRLFDDVLDLRCQWSELDRLSDGPAALTDLQTGVDQIQKSNPKHGIVQAFEGRRPRGGSLKLAEVDDWH